MPENLRAALRPGLTGRGKIELGRRPLHCHLDARRLELVPDADDRLTTCPAEQRSLTP